MNVIHNHNRPPTIRKPFIVGYMSTDQRREYNSDLSQLKFLTYIPKGTLHFDLNHNIDKAVKRTTDDNDEKISLLLKFILDQNRLLKTNESMFITYRRTLISVMCKAFDAADPIYVTASLFDGAIYLCSVESPQELQRRQCRSRQDEKFCAWGYKFEQFMLSDAPSLHPDIGKPVIENEEFSLFYRSALRQHELLYGAQIDGLLAVDNFVPNPPKTHDVETNLSYLRSNSFVELKTNREIQNRRQEHNFKKYKLLRCWCQCYLAGLEGLLVGFRNDHGIIERLQWYKTEDIVAYCKNEWDPETALEFLDSFLTFVKKCLSNHIEKTCGSNNDINNIGPVTLKFEIDVDKTIKVSNCKNDNDLIIPNWYVEGKRRMHT